MSSLKYHISTNGPRVCSAQVKLCPKKEHFSNRFEAEQFYEKKMNKRHAPMRGFRKK